MLKVTKQETFEIELSDTSSLFHRYEFENGDFYWTNALSVYNEEYQSLEDGYQEYLIKNE